MNYLNYEISFLNIDLSNMFFDYQRKFKEILELNIGDVNEPDEYGNTLLHYAAKHNLTKLVWKLNRKHANFSIRNFIGDTPFHIACKHHNLYIVEEIYRQNSSKHIKNNEGKTGLDYLTKSEKERFERFEDRFHGFGKYEYKPKPEPFHHFGGKGCL
jgi:ankyrin repeat protein